ncbi:MAG: hypothetical protein PHC41_01325 [Lachnospiraceae bacterium]|jgi:hypothetical protein|nr:hypothetical protein [Lachnospiraceae bacterium]MDD3614848.1 hypothetical protein [Lachnospiraceae bacterium]
MSKNEVLFRTLHTDLIPYYRSWAHDCPMIVSYKRDQELHRVQQLLYRCCEYYVHHYEEYLSVIPYEEKVLEILERAKANPYMAGTFRPDYVICEDGTLHVCEITSRFFGNGYFLSYFMEHAGAVFAKENHITDYKSYFNDFLDYAAEYLGNKKKLIVLKSADKSDSIKLYAPYYEALGAKVTILEANQVEKSRKKWDNALVVSALNQKDLLSFSMDTIQKMIDVQCKNDFRTIFLLHDKRVFHLFYMDEFIDKVLNQEDKQFLQEHMIPTYIRGKNLDIWEDAKNNKDGYILKHCRLGKSEKVFAGSLCSEEEWKKIFASDDMEEMILQPFLQQKLYPTIWHDEPLNDYVSGTILCVDDKYFGTGLFRTSTSPVINQVDAHKVAPVITNQVDSFKEKHIL